MGCVQTTWLFDTGPERDATTCVGAVGRPNLEQTTLKLRCAFVPCEGVLWLDQGAVPWSGGTRRSQMFLAQLRARGYNFVIQQQTNFLMPPSTSAKMRMSRDGTRDTLRAKDV